MDRLLTGAKLGVATIVMFGTFFGYAERKFASRELVQAEVHQREEDFKVVRDTLSEHRRVLDSIYTILVRKGGRQ